MIEVVQASNRADLTRREFRDRARAVLENGGVVHLPLIGFELLEREKTLVDPARTVELHRGKPRNSGRPTLLFYQRTGKLRGGKLKGVPSRDVAMMMNRFADWAHDLVRALLPAYAPMLEVEFTTFRPCARTSKQKLHMDAAIARPTQGRGMLRVFCNVNQAGAPRIWHVGGHFEQAVGRFVPRLPPRLHEPIPGASRLYQLLGISKGPATPYDYAMRRLRDLMTTDEGYQRSAQSTTVEFPAGSTWLAFTDLALHGAVSGQHSLDQTFLVRPEALQDQERSSLRILENLTGRCLV